MRGPFSQWMTSIPLRRMYSKRLAPSRIAGTAERAAATSNLQRRPAADRAELRRSKTDVRRAAAAPEHRRSGRPIRLALGEPVVEDVHLDPVPVEEPHQRGMHGDRRRARRLRHDEEHLELSAQLLVREAAAGHGEIQPARQAHRRGLAALVDGFAFQRTPHLRGDPPPVKNRRSPADNGRGRRGSAAGLTAINPPFTASPPLPARRTADQRSSNVIGTTFERRPPGAGSASESTPLPRLPAGLGRRIERLEPARSRRRAPPTGAASTPRDGCQRPHRPESAIRAPRLNRPGRSHR